MTTLFAVLFLVFLGLWLVEFIKARRLKRESTSLQARVFEMEDESSRLRQDFGAEFQRLQKSAEQAVQEAQKLIDQQAETLKQDSDRIRQHYESEARKALEAANQLVAKTVSDYEPLRRFEGLKDAEAKAHRMLAEALAEATRLRQESVGLLEQSRVIAMQERSQASQRAKEIREQADALLDRATRDAGAMVESAHKKAEEIGGDAYRALREKESLEQAVKAIQNIIDGYGDRYIIPTHSLLDDLAEEFSHTDAGHSLKAAREQQRRMIEERQAADCDYVEPYRRETAIRFVIDAFNGRVEAILSRTKNDNFGTLEQEIRDAFALVNENGKAFKDARIQSAYLDVRLAELKWAVVVHELREKQREEQRRIKEQIREEEKARREYERAIQEAEKEEMAIKKALERAKSEEATASAEQRAKLEEQIALLNQKLTEAEARNRRAVSMAQQTRKGNVYIISNVGSFGDGVFKIGMTRRLEPFDRIKELGDASVPFEFDVHAMISSEDAPTLEGMLHAEFDAFRVNQVNFRKEFFRLPLERLRNFVTGKGMEVSFTMIAAAHEYRETQAINKMAPEERQKYYQSKYSGDTFEGD